MDSDNELNPISNLSEVLSDIGFSIASSDDIDNAIDLEMWDGMSEILDRENDIENLHQNEIPDDFVPNFAHEVIIDNEDAMVEQDLPQNEPEVMADNEEPMEQADRGNGEMDGQEGQLQNNFCHDSFVKKARFVLVELEKGRLLKLPNGNIKHKSENYVSLIYMVTQSFKFAFF